MKTHFHLVHSPIRLLLAILLMAGLASCSPREEEMEHLSQEHSNPEPAYQLKTDDGTPRLTTGTGAEWSFGLNDDHKTHPAGDDLQYERAIGDSDLRIYQKNGLTAYDLILPAGGDPQGLVLPLQSHQRARVHTDGSLIVTDNGGYWKHAAPIAYQDLPRGRQAVDCHFVVDEQQVRFALGYYNPDFELVIDPVIQFLMAACSGAMDELGGRVYHDMNNNGTYDAMEDPGIENAAVRIYDCTSETPVSTTTTDANGQYTFTGLTIGTRYRLEIDAPDGSDFLPAFAGPDNNSTVQYGLPGSCAADVGFLTVADYCDETALRIVLPCYENGSGVGNNQAVMVSFDYDLSGTSTPPQIDFTAAELGSVYGTAFFPGQSLVFSSAFLKRHSGLGPRGLDGIYALDYSGLSPSLVGGFNLQGVVPGNGGDAIDLGSINRTNVAGSITGPFDMPNDRTESSIDLDAFAKIGTVGYGDIDMGESGKYLWMVNLHQRAILKIAVDSLAVSGAGANTPSSGAVEQFPLDGAEGIPTCTDGVLRPFGLEFANGLGYLGCVCDASGAADTIRPAELTGHVLSFDTANVLSFTEELSFSFDYPREAAYFNRGDSLGGEWHQWIDTFPKVTNTITGLNFVSAPQPIISDLELLDNGDLVLAVMDRFAHQSGTQNLTALVDSDSLVSGINAGDILYAEQNMSGDFVLEHSSENDPGRPPSVPNPYPGFLENDGVTGMGEFFWGDYFVVEIPTADEGHYETATGGLAYRSGSNEIAATVFDPVSFFSQGLRYFNLTTGGYTRNYRILETDFDSPSGGGKGSSLGDPELICGVPPVQLGNYAWIDADEDGIQDPCEDPLVGLPVYLYDMNGNELASTTTQEDGSYYFTEPGTSGEDWIAEEGVQRNTMYYIGFGDSTIIELDDTRYGVTTDSTGIGDNPNINDSDPSVQETLGGELGRRAVVKVTTHSEGGADHTIDAGFIDLGPPQNIPCQPLSCPNQLNITVDFDCEFVLTPEMLLRNLQVSADEYEIRILNQDGHLVITDTITSEHVGRTVTYMIYRLGCESFPCYGKLKIEDKTGPLVAEIASEFDTLECGLETFVRNNEQTIDPNSPYYLGEVFFEDNCAPDCATTAKFFDTYEAYPCDSLPLTGRMTRKWTATDCNGLETEVNQYFYFKRPDLADLIKGEDETIITCTPTVEDLPDMSGPYWINVFGETMYLRDVDCGGYALHVEDINIPVCGNTGSFKHHQFYRVFDWCTNTSTYVDTVTIKVGDFAAPEFQGNAYVLPNNQPAITQLQGIVDRDSLLVLDALGKIPTLSTGPSDCTTAFSTLPGILQQQFGFSATDCGNVTFTTSVLTFAPQSQGGFPGVDTVWKERTYYRFNDMIAGIGVGMHALVIEAKDDCYQNGRAVVFFKVADQISPVMKCDDEIHITLTNGSAIASGGYARVYPRSVEEGSWDNCALGNLQVRRMIPEQCIPDFIEYGYDLNDDGELDQQDGIVLENDGQLYTPWEDYVEFFCCDLAEAVKVEVRGSDESRDPLSGVATPNQSVCWLDVIVEDKVDPRLLAPAALTVDCSDPRLADLPAFGDAQLMVDYCGNMLIQELAATENLDRCGFGTITRRFQAVKYPGTDREIMSPVVSQTITVVERNDYSICFPEDVSVTCGNDPDIPGITFAENACDLMAISTEDNLFTATQDPDACYKVFRTYKVINWCEYDGESAPTLVGRDWDGFNGTNPGNCANPLPQGDLAPGDEGICVIVRKNSGDLAPDTVYYDSDTDPSNNIPDDGSTAEVEGYWWRVISGSHDPTEEAYYEGNCSSWSDDDNQLDSDISGNVSGDDSDIRYGSFGYWVYTQHIIVYDDAQPDVELIGDEVFCASSDVDCSGNISYTLVVDDNCTGLEDYTVTVFLDIDNDGSLDQNITPALDGNDLTGRFPTGEHRIQVRVNDGCGNVRVIDQVFEIEDCLAPAPICLSNISVTLMPTQDSRLGALPIFATELIASEIYDCTGQGESNGQGRNLVTEYFVARDETPNMSDLDPLRAEDHIIVTCDDVGQMIPLELHAMDGAGNNDYCVIFVEVADNQSVCESPEATGLISGGIATTQQELVEGVTVQLSGGQSMMYETDQSGAYNFQGLIAGHDFTVIPKMDKDPMNGVSTFDMVLIQKHILGTQALASPYQLIAADINASGSISTLDLIQLRKMVLNVDNNFRNNTSWRFVDADYRFPNPANPWQEPFPEIKNINNLEGEMISDFIAIKIGDLNGNVTPNSASPVASRSAEAPYEMVLGQAENHGSTTRIPVQVQDDRAVPGLQFTLDLPSSTLDILPAVLSENDMAWFREDSKMTVSYAPHTAENLDGAVLFYLELNGHSAAEDMSRIQLSLDLTPAEAYTVMGDPLSVVLLNGTPESEASAKLLPNEPNPFRTETVIPFVLQRPQSFQIDLFDARGRHLKQVRGEGDRGRNEVLIQASDLQGAGLYYYRLQTGGYEASGTMMYQQ